ncbi:putative ferric-chelate reductase 1 isoform X3 [Petromyzon marinus]|uniref:putative ferric-chelate reductase 1 isoform X3 n=1 Tax=Petromyzon marinus TaxID=7757 RepID=UPI003F704D3C
MSSSGRRSCNLAPSTGWACPAAWSLAWANRLPRCHLSCQNVNSRSTTSRIRRTSLDAASPSRACASPARCDPSSGSCFFVAMTPEPASEQVAVEISGPDSGYLALGFSGDTWMGDDDIYQCTILNGRPIIGTSYSSGRDIPSSYSNPILLASMSNASARVADGMLQCSFTLSQVATEPRKADLKKQYYLFLAHGETDDGEIEKHDVQPMVSRYRIAPLGSPVEVAVTRSNNLVKAHGALMLVAWLSLCSVGVVLARFFKPVWPNTKLLGEKVWFQLHRGLMVLAVLTTITAFVIPFCYRLGWSGRAHSVLGCIVMFLALMQPIMAVFRPHPNTPMRPLFNWAHWFVGTAARILAAACLFLGVDMVALDLPDRWDKLLLMGALLWQLAAEALLEILGCFGADHKSGESFEMSHVVQGLREGKLQHNHNSKLHNVKSAVLGVYVAGNVAFLIALLVGVGNV